jgi:hypothetical protein
MTARLLFTETSGCSAIMAFLRGPNYTLQSMNYTIHSNLKKEDKGGFHGHGLASPPKWQFFKMIEYGHIIYQKKGNSMHNSYLITIRARNSLFLKYILIKEHHLLCLSCILGLVLG